MAAALGTTQEAVDGRVTMLFRRMAGDDGAGTGLLGEFKKLHAAVVEQSATATSLKSYVPSQFVDALARGGDAASQRELEVTILFSDIRGFSTIAERLTARESGEIVGRHLGAMAEVISEHGGRSNKFQGDAVMAVFGAPEPSEDHAERALQCAKAMQDRQRELNSMGWGTDAVDGLHVGIGLNTGVVMAGAIGGGGRLEYTVIGDAVNVAQRLQSEAGGGEVVAAASTVSAAPSIAAEPIGPRLVKGRRSPVEVFRMWGWGVMAATRPRRPPHGRLDGPGSCSESPRCSRPSAGLRVLNGYSLSAMHELHRVHGDGGRGRAEPSRAPTIGSLAPPLGRRHGGRGITTENVDLYAPRTARTLSRVARLAGQRPLTLGLFPL